jgi:glycosyltransferase involved in cell wall biosynthesis
MGFESEVYASAVHSAFEGKVHLLHELDGAPQGDRFLVYQLCAQSPISDWLIGRSEPVAVNYHNVTPPSFFRPWDRSAFLAQMTAGLQAAQLSRVASIGICVSEANAMDLQQKGWSAESTPVVPVLMDLDDFDVQPDPKLSETLAARDADARSGTRWLFVGALSPHKQQHVLVRALALYRKTYDPRASLTLVGSPRTVSYSTALKEYVAELGLQKAVTVAGAVSHAELVAHYNAADVFVSASGHEGFCVPLVEALHHNLPVLALAAGAVPATLGDAGILLPDASAPTIAAAVARVQSDGALRASLREAAQRRLAELSLDRTREQMEAVVRAWVAAGGSWPARRAGRP